MKVRQPQDEVEDALDDYLRRAVLTPAIIEQAIAEICDEVERQLAAPDTDIAAIEAKLTQLRTEQKKIPARAHL